MAVTHRASKLVVILHADVAGSTTLVQQDEHVAHERIQQTYRRFANIITRYHGRVRELRGDALLAEFERASDAVTAALAFQADQATHNNQIDDAIRPAVRVGIAMGEVVFADRTVTGAGVVLAQRMEQLAEPGGVCLTGAIHEALPQRMPFTQDDLGEQRLKGFDEPVRVYAVQLKQGAELPKPAIGAKLGRISRARWVTTTVAVVLICGIGLLAWVQPWKPESTERVAFPLPDKPSIAVLPFDSLSDDPDQRYFADGMTDDLITDLSQISGIFVIARNSSFAYEGIAVDIHTVARELGVQYLLEGSVRRTGDRVRINSQLIDATTGGHVWAERYDEPFTEVFDLQDSVTRRIVAALKVELTPQEQAVAGARGTSNVAAYDAFLTGSAYLHRRTPEDALKAITYFKQALNLDLNYARAHGALAQTYWDYSNDKKFNSIVDPSLGASFARSGHMTHVNAWRFLQKARSHPSSQTHTLTARMLQRQRRFDEAMQAARQAVALGPNDPRAHDALIENLIYAGETKEALRLIDASIKLDPKSPGEKLFLRGMAFYTMERFEDAVSVIDEARSHNPNSTRYPVIQAAALAELDRTPAAMVALEQSEEYARASHGNLNWSMFYWPFRHSEDIERLANSLVKAGLTVPSRPYYHATQQNRLSGEQIKSLLSDRVMRGADRGYFAVGDDEFEVVRNHESQIISQGALNYFRKNGTTWIENDALCDIWLDFGEYCVAIYRNPFGDERSRDEYLFFIMMSTFSFSVFDLGS